MLLNGDGTGTYGGTSDEVYVLVSKADEARDTTKIAIARTNAAFLRTTVSFAGLILLAFKLVGPTTAGWLLMGGVIAWCVGVSFFGNLYCGHYTKLSMRGMTSQHDDCITPEASDVHVGLQDDLCALLLSQYVCVQLLRTRS